MTLTVRLDPALESALERHCAERCATESLVVQESLAAYLTSGLRRGSVPALPAEPDALNRIATLDVTGFSVYRIHGRARFQLELLR